MVRIFAACPRYIQGPGAAAQLADIARSIGPTAVIVIDAHVRGLIGPSLLAGFGTADRIIEFAGEITLERVDAMAKNCRDAAFAVVVAIGGGKALDAGKAVARRLALPVITVPTIASTDAPASRGIAIYDDEHRLVRVEQLDSNPAAVVVDTAILAAAPEHFLRCGIGDAVAKKFEAEAAFNAGALNKHGTRPLQAGLIAADGCYRLLRRHGAGAMAAAARGKPDEDFEAAVEACFLLSALGFENTGLSMAHSLTRGLVKARGAKDAPHGYHVGYGLLVQFAVEARDRAEVEDMRGFLIQVGLPSTLAELGMPAPAGDEIAGIAQLTMDSPHIGNLPRPIDASDIANAIKLVEAL